MGLSLPEYLLEEYIHTLITEYEGEFAQDVSHRTEPEHYR